MITARSIASLLLLFLLGTVVAGAWQTAAAAEPEASLSPEMRAIEVADRRGDRLDTGLSFVDHQGNPVVLADFFDGERPVAFTLNYYRCRVVCSVQLGGLADAIAEVDWDLGGDYRVVTLSIDPHEKPVDAAKKRSTIAEVVGKGSDIDWSFLTGDELNIRALASQLGIGYAYDAEQDQYAHPGVVVFVTPDGRISRYVYGLTYDPLDVKLGLYEAGDGEIGGPVEQLYLSCFSYDPTIGRYGPFAMGIMRLGGSLTALILGAFMFILWRRERRQPNSRFRGETSTTEGRTTAGPGAEAV
ncbi:MAG: SCO family protein [Nannocystaceae bacterium]